MQNDNEVSSVENTNQPSVEKVEVISGLENNIPEGIDEEKEAIYKKTVKFMKSLKCMTPCNDKVKMYKEAAQQFLDLGGYQESETYAKKCKKRAKKTKEEIKKEFYDKALDMKKKAKSPQAYEEAAAKFRKAKGYLDAEEMAQQCEQRKTSMEKKMVRNVFVKYGTVGLCVIALIFCLFAPSVKYLVADINRTIGIYKPAIHLYAKLGTYKDSEEKLAQSRYLYGVRLMDKENYVEASKLFAAAGDYQDSEVKNVETEKQIIKNSKVGEFVKVGNCKWIIIDKQKDRALLMKKSALTGNKKVVNNEDNKASKKKVKLIGIIYHNNLENVTWENSSIRNFLNSEFVDETFSKKERDNMIQSTIINDDNDVYGTDGGNNTQDYIFLLSTKEAKKYSSKFPKFKTDSWLRSPGKGQDSAAFLSQDGDVMDYGYAVNSKDFTARPAYWFKLN